MYVVSSVRTQGKYDIRVCKHQEERKRERERGEREGEEDVRVKIGVEAEAEARIEAKAEMGAKNGWGRRRHRKAATTLDTGFMGT